MAIVEAKSADLEVREGVEQAKRYAAKLNLETTYATNGKEIYSICMKTGRRAGRKLFKSGRTLAQTYSDENKWRDIFTTIPYQDKSGTWKLRFYQEIAVRNTLEAIAQNKKPYSVNPCHRNRQNTAIAFQIAWKLFYAC
ncbi:MAG: hypothetical protein R2728_02395 [Chitinophagales bacterium]